MKITNSWILSKILHEMYLLYNCF